MAFRFVHAADIHLDSPLRSLALRDPDLAELVAGASRRAFTAIVDLCLEEQVDALVLAGDLYDGDQSSMHTATFLANELRRLHEAAIPAFIVRGNHDALSRITKELILPPSVKIFGSRAEVTIIEAPGQQIAVHGLSFAQPRAPESLLPRYRAPVEGAVNVGIMHTSLGGAPGHDQYAPCSLAELDASGFRFWALGHVHARAVHEGRCMVVMAGMPQGRDVGECGPKGATLVTVRDDGSIDAAPRRTSLVEFARAEVDLSGAVSWEDAVARCEAALDAARAAAASEHLVVRLTLVGETPLAWRMRRDGDLLRTEAEDRAARIGRTFLDKLEVRTRPPADGGAGALAELRCSVKDEIERAPGFVAAVMAAMDELRHQLPPECRGAFGTDQQKAEALARELAAIGCEEVFARLAPEEER